MTTDKARKRAVRTRMTKTGESYAAARRMVTKEPAPPAPRPRCRRARPDPASRTMPCGAPPARIGTTGSGSSMPAASRASRTPRPPPGSRPSTASTAGGPSRSRSATSASEGCAADTRRATASRSASRRRSDSTSTDSGPRSPTTRHAPPGRCRRSCGGARPSRTSRSVSTTATTALASSSRSIPKGSDRATVTITHERMAGPDDVERMRAFWRAQVKALETWLEADAASG